MIAVYMDESGNTGTRLNDPAQPFHHIGALVVPEAQWRGIRDAMQAVCDHVTQWGLDSPEFHGNLLFHGNKEWAVLTEPQRIAIYEQCAAILESHDVFMVIGSADKSRLNRYPDPMDPRDVAFWMALEQLAQATALHNELVFVVADDTDAETRQRIRNLLARYRRAGPPFGSPVDVGHIIDTVHFMNSRDSLHLQLCDLALFGFHRMRAKNNGSFSDVFRRMYNRVRYRRAFPYAPLR